MSDDDPTLRDKPNDMLDRGAGTEWTLVFRRQAEVPPSAEQDRRLIEFLATHGSIPELSVALNRFKNKQYTLLTRFPDLRQLADVHPQRHTLVALDRKIKLHQAAIALLEAQPAKVELKTSASLAKRDDLPNDSAAWEAPKPDPIAAERDALLTAFKAKGRGLGIRITDEMVAKAAKPGKWNDRTMVTWWKRNDSKSKPPHDKRIRAVLDGDPSRLTDDEPKPK